MSELTHFDGEGRARMVDVSEKSETRRVARASGRVRMAADTLRIVSERRAKKGDVVAVAELAGIQGAKRTADLIPLCHPLPLEAVEIDVALDADLPGIVITATARTFGRTGVEMEALTAVSSACLTVYDMLKAVDRGMTIEDVMLLEKAGGRSGHWSREGTAREGIA